MRRASYQPSIREGVFQRRPQMPVQRDDARRVQLDAGSQTGHQAGSVGDFSGGRPPSAKDAAKMATAVIWREAPHWLTGEQAAMALGLSAVADLDRMIADGKLGLVGKPSPGGRMVYARDAVRALLLAGG